MQQPDRHLAPFAAASLTWTRRTQDRIAAKLGLAPSEITRQVAVLHQRFQESFVAEPIVVRLARLRDQFYAWGIDALLVPHSDAFLGEYLPLSHERLRYITDFTGSAGFALITVDQAFLFVDGRYTAQAGFESNPAHFSLRNYGETEIFKAMEAAGLTKARLGIDPWVFALRDAEHYQARHEAAGGTWIELDCDPIGSSWPDRPPSPCSLVELLPLAFAGVPSAIKLRDLGAEIKCQECDAAILAAPESVAWLFNLRGGDVPMTPLCLSRAFVWGDGRATWLVNPDCLDDTLRSEMTQGDADDTGRAGEAGEKAGLNSGIEILPLTDWDAALAQFAGKRVLLDPNRSPAALARGLRQAGAKVVSGRDPCVLPKARKNPTEQAGFRDAHERDAVAMIRFLCWLDQRLEEAKQATENLPFELELVERLTAFRFADERCRDLSFDAIVGSGPHGAIIHYRASAKTNRQLAFGETLLIDSGGQYLSGTTDITRTLAIGEIDARIKHICTLVLKGHLALGRARFPKGISGGRLDSLARAPLWSEGLDFGHGTGHGVGHYLSVHEGPQRISSRGDDPVALEVGMVLSNEPGYYEDGNFGVRIENLVLVVDVSTKDPKGPKGSQEVLGFETLTLVPYDRKLFNVALLDGQEITEINAYHREIWQRISPKLGDKERDWLQRATIPLTS